MSFIQQLQFDQLEKLYQTKIKEDFPPEEVRPFNIIERLTKQEQYIAFGYYGETGEILGYAFLVKPYGSEAAMLDYYAVSSHMRGTGMGGSFIAEFQKLLAPMGIEYVLLEVECVETAANNEETHVRSRRIHFYEKNDCCMSGVRSKVFGVDYNIMYLPFSNNSLTDQTIMNELNQIYHLLFQPILKTDTAYRQQVQLWL